MMISLGREPYMVLPARHQDLGLGSAAISGAEGARYRAEPGVGPNVECPGGQRIGISELIGMESTDSDSVDCLRRREDAARCDLGGAGAERNAGLLIERQHLKSTRRHVLRVERGIMVAGADDEEDAILLAR